MTNKKIHLVHLYPREMNIYGDNGNMLIVRKRLEWRGYDVIAHMVNSGDKLPNSVHFIMGGGGQDKGQSSIAKDLKSKSLQLKSLADAGVPMLMICGMYQMLGHYFKTSGGERIPGIGLLDIYTIAGKGRLIGNIEVKSSNYGLLVGYENHSGLTYLNDGMQPIGTTLDGMGNNGKDGSEGAVYNNVFGSYLHGPILAKSPQFADYLIEKTLLAAGFDGPLEKLDDSMELRAAEVAKTRPR